MNHDTIARRLAQILVKLNQGESLHPRDLAEEFNVGLRTIQRDLVQRFAYLGLEKQDGMYRLPPHVLGRLTTSDIRTFAELAGVQRLFPSLTHAAVVTLLKRPDEHPVMVREQPYESMAHREQDFDMLRCAIESRTQIEFMYEALTAGAAPKLFTNVQPYRLVHQRGVWYLAGRHKGKLKTFSLFALQSPRREDVRFEPDQALNEELDKAASVWQTGQQTVEVKIEVAAVAAPYFERRELLAGQRIEARRPDGSLLLSVEAGDMRQVLPIVQQWLPHLHIIQPAHWQESLESTLRGYLAKKTAALSEDATPPVA